MKENSKKVALRWALPILVGVSTGLYLADIFDLSSIIAGLLAGAMTLVAYYALLFVMPPGE